MRQRRHAPPGRAGEAFHSSQATLSTCASQTQGENRFQEDVSYLAREQSFNKIIDGSPRSNHFVLAFSLLSIIFASLFGGSFVMCRLQCTGSGGQCVWHEFQFFCQCDRRWTGPNCEHTYPHGLMKTGRCQRGRDCKCEQGWKGEFCEIRDYDTRACVANCLTDKTHPGHGQCHASCAELCFEDCR